MKPPTLLDTPCIEFTGSVDKDGYGIVGVVIEGRKTSRRAHRLAWEDVNGPIPRGLLVMHRCDNPPCIRVDHLKLGTHLDNNRDREAKGRGFRSPLWMGPRLFGESHSRAKLTEQQVREIRHALEVGSASGRELGVRYGVSAAHISYIKSGRYWKHVA